MILPVVLSPRVLDGMEMNVTFLFLAEFNHEMPLGVVALALESVTNCGRRGPERGSSFIVFKLLLGH